MFDDRLCQFRTSDLFSSTVYSIALISTGEYKRAEQYGRASMWVAVAGICVTFVIALVLLISSAAGGF
jgi:hypothetical protein